MVWDIVLAILGIILVILWFIWCFVPVLAGPLLAFLGLVSLQIAFWCFSIEFLIISGIITVVVSIVDNIIPVIWAKKMWWSKFWVRGSIVWLVVSVIILPIFGIVIWPFGLFGLILGPFFWAWIGEYLWQKDWKKSFKPAIWSFLGFVAGILLKVIVTLILAYFFFVELFKIWVSYFW